VIVIDTSALVAVVLREERAAACMKVLESETQVLVSAGTMTEALIVAARRHVVAEMAGLIDGLDLQVVTVTSASARWAAHAYQQWGKGFHRAALNFGDCFAYALAKEHSCALLFVGGDFSKTDIESVL
jgi:ribonuclease VapC